MVLQPRRLAHRHKKRWRNFHKLAKEEEPIKDSQIYPKKVHLHRIFHGHKFSHLCYETLNHTLIIRQGHRSSPPPAVKCHKPCREIKKVCMLYPYLLDYVCRNGEAIQSSPRGNFSGDCWEWAIYGRTNKSSSSH